MSTILLSPTHIASDHTVVENTLPHRTYVDINHPKMFVSPDNQFVIAITGKYDKKEMVSEEYMNLFKGTLSILVDWEKRSDNDIINLKNDIIIEFFKSLIDNNKSSIMLVTKLYRFIIKYNDVLSIVQLKRIPKYAAMGTGGWIGMGLLEGGIKIEDTFKIVSRWDPLTSEQYSLINLEDLDDFVSIEIGKAN